MTVPVGGDIGDEVCKLAATASSSRQVEKKLQY